MLHTEFIALKSRSPSVVSNPEHHILLIYGTNQSPMEHSIKSLPEIYVDRIKLSVVGLHMSGPPQV